MASISQQLPDVYYYIENETHYEIRPVQYPQDIALLHRWMHQPHVIPQWQLNKSEQELMVYFDKMLADDHQRLVIIRINGQEVGYAEIYEAKRDRLGRYYAADVHDLGWHLLFGEVSTFGKGYLRATIRLLNFYIFEHSQAQKIVGEPDHTVKPYAAVVADMCYQAIRPIVMAEKTAMLYYCHRHEFYQKFSNYLHYSQAEIAHKVQTIEAPHELS